MEEDMNSSNEMSESRFYMWRTLFAVAHADDVVTDQEIEFMAHILEDIDFTIEQTAILKDDISNPKDVEEMFRGMKSVDDRNEFFDFARDLVWVDGEFGEPEQGVMVNLLQKHLNDVDFDDLVGNVSLQFEDEKDPVPNLNVDAPPRTGNVFGSLFRNLFGKN